MKITEITIEKIINKNLAEIIPEIYELKGIIENNRSHNNDSVFLHTLSVLTQLEEIFKIAGEKTKNYLSQKVNSYPVKDILFFAGVFHDVGKKETLRRDGETTACPGHEAKSAEKLKEIMNRSDLSEKEREMAIRIVENHGYFHGLLDHPGNDLEKKTKEFKEKYPDIFLAEILFTLADVLGGYLKTNNPDDFNFRVQFLNKAIENY